MNTFAGGISRGNDGGEAPRIISLTELVSGISEQRKREIISGYDLKNFARIFEDAELMTAISAYLDNGMNISETSRKLYMHRNTLMYRMKKIKEQTGLDLRNFDMALTFEILNAFYKSERGKS